MFLTFEEIDKAESVINRMVQSESFPRELKDLSHGGRVQVCSQLAALAPFLDETGIIRVGGRLKRANLPYDQKHPIVLPARHHITEIILRQEHVRLQHCGPQQLLASIRTRYWPLSWKEGGKKSSEEMHIVF